MEGAGPQLPAEPPSGAGGNWDSSESPKLFPSPEQAEGPDISIPNALPLSVLYKLFIQL